MIDLVIGVFVALFVLLAAFLLLLLLATGILMVLDMLCLQWVRFRRFMGWL